MPNDVLGKANENKEIVGRGARCDALNRWTKDNKGRRARKAQDPFWYAADQADVERLANFPWNAVVGTQLSSALSDMIGGMMIIPYYRTAGHNSLSGPNVLTRQANTYFQYMAQGFTGSVTGFEAPDLLMSGAAGSSLMADMTEGKRAFGMLNYFSDQNEYYGKKMFESLGFHYESFTKEHSKADFVTDYNIRVDQINKTIAIPIGMKVDMRWDYLAANVFSDNSDPDFNTLFAYKCVGSMIYTPVDWSTGTSLKWYDKYNTTEVIEESEDVEIIDGKLTYEGFFNRIDRMISTLTGDDQRQMFAALRRVYSEDKFSKLGTLTEDYVTPIVRNDIVSAAVHNGIYCESVTTNYDESGVGASLTVDGPNNFTVNAGYPVIQNNKGKILAQVYGVFTDTALASDAYYALDPDQEALIDLFGHLVTPGNVLDVTAMMPGLGTVVLNDNEDEDRTTYNTLYCRSEVFLRPIMYYNNEDGDFVSQSVYLHYDTSDFDADSFMEQYSMLSHINSAPFVLQVKQKSGAGVVGTTYQVVRRLGEIDTYTGISQVQLGKMHERTINQLYAMPKSDKSVT